MIPALSRARELSRSGYQLSALSTKLPVKNGSELVGDYFLIDCSISSGSTQTKVRALIDTGGSGNAFIDSDYAHSLNLPLLSLETPHALHVFDGRETASGRVTHYVLLDILTGHHASRQTPCFVTQLHNDPLVLGLPWLRDHKVIVDCEKNCLVFDSDDCLKRCMTAKTTVPCVPKSAIERPKQDLDICLVGAAPIARLAQRKGHQLFMASMRDIEKALAPKKEVDVLSKLPEEYHDFASLFSRKEADKLPPHRPYDHTIPLAPGKEPPFGSLYNMSRDELQVLKNYLEEHLAKGFIRASSSPAASPVIFVRKPGGGLRLCVDYRGINNLTVKNRYPLPLIRETLNMMSDSVVFTKLDIIAAFNKLRMAEGEEWKTAMRTRYGLFEYLVMPFGLCGAPSSFQRYINDVLRDCLDVYATAYIDDILIFSKNLREHRKHVRTVLTKLRDAGLYIDIEKCEFHVEEVKYLGLIIAKGKIMMDPAKIAAIVEWKTPRNVKDIQSFLGFANFYRRFIKGFSQLAGPLTALTHKGVEFIWSPAAEFAFQLLKKNFASAPILVMFDPEKPCTVESDSSDCVTGGVLSQPDSEGVLRPVAYFSTRMAPAECNYDIYDKELLAIIRAFEEWRPELEGAAEAVQVITDHKNLEYFMTTKQLSRRQARWSEFLSRFNFAIQYRPGRLNSRADALTRRSDDFPENDEDPRHARHRQLVLKPQNLSPELAQHMSLRPTIVTPVPELPGAAPASSEAPTADELTDQEELQDLIATAYADDPLAQEVVQALRSGARRVKHFPLAECVLRDDLVYYRDRLFVPDSDPLRLKIFKLCHDSPLAGHPGKAKLTEIVARTYWWPDWTKHVTQYVRNCHECFRAKPSRLRYQGALKPLPVPERRWKDISVDFVEGLPPSPNLDGVLCSTMMVVVDRLSKQIHTVPMSSTTAQDTAKAFYHRVFALHGLPSTIISDRGTQFVSHFWQSLCEILGIKSLLSTAFHPQLDGQTERTNGTVETYLRMFVDMMQNDWARWCPSAEFACNNHVSEATTCTPFFANSGQHPRMGTEPFEINVTLPERDQAQQELAHTFATKMDTINELLKVQMTRAQAAYEVFANRRRDHAPVLRAGDMVWLDARNLATNRPSKKLSNKFEGPFKVLRTVGTHACQLEIPDSWGNHDVFGNYLIHLSANDPLPGQHPPVPFASQNIHGEDEWEVERISHSRMHRGQLQFLTHWTGFDRPTYEPFDNVKDASESLTDYFQRHPIAIGHESWTQHLKREEDNDGLYSDDASTTDSEG